MALEIKLNQKLTQSLVMTPQLQQAIKLLQLGRLEYLEVIEKELLENPVLEDARESGDSIVAENRGTDAAPADNADHLLAQLDQGESRFENNSTSDFSDVDVRFDWHEYVDVYSDSWHAAPGGTGRQREDDERPSIEATLTKPEGLVSHVLWQLRTAGLSSDEQEIAVQIVGNLDRDGYLETTLEELAESCRCTAFEVERVLSIVQSLDPVGIAARDLRECLLIQLRQLGFEDSLVWRIVDRHLDKLETRRYDVVAKDEKVLAEEVYEAIKIIRKLEPRPGRPFIDEAPVYITPDIYVRRVGHEYVISLNEAGMPRLRVNSQYRELLLNGSLKDAPNREYLQDRLRSAAWLIKSIHQRQQTIYRVTESIMKFQRDFLDHGVSALKPLVLRDVAEDVSMHESTISRVTTNKYVHTPQGVFELKFFFTSGLRSGQGEVSSESVKERIRALVSAENPQKPMSDQAIVEILRAEGVDIARRTVAKYREMMNILSSSRRKKVF